MEAQQQNMERSEPQSSAASEVTALGGEGESFDFEGTLKDIVKQRDQAGIKPRELGVLFDGLKVIGLGATASFQPTLGAIFSGAAMWQGIKAGRHPPVRDILVDFSGVVRPGEMLLVLGSPGSGCSTLLKTLTNQRKEYHKVEGEVFYDSLTPEQMLKEHRGDVVYNQEDDVHFPSLTVQQTVEFAARARAPQKRPGQSRKEHIVFLSNIYTTILGLNPTKTTPVGDAAIRGVSGGEKKRVSISEALVSRGLINAWDNSTRGLDASTALEFAQALRLSTDIGRVTTISSIYQAGENLYTTFDKVCVIYEGHMIYFGPGGHQARQYFINMGYEPANRQTTPDFLVAVTSPGSRFASESYDRQNRPPVPKTAEEFANYYRSSETWQHNRRDMDDYKRDCVGKEERVSQYKQSVKQEMVKGARPGSSHIISIPMQVRAVMVRRVNIIRGNWTAQALSVFTYGFQAIIIGTLFLKVKDDTSAFFSRGGIMFFIVFLPALFSMSEIPALFAQRPIIHRQSQAALYHPYIEAIAITIVDLPVIFVSITLYCVLVYFLVGLQQTAGQFFIFFLFTFTVAVTMKSAFRSLAAACAAEASAQAIGGLLLFFLSLYTGYNIPQPSMIKALSWLTHINPLRYAFESLMTNEFHTLRGTCSTLVPSGPGYENVDTANQVCTTVGSQPGQTFVEGSRYVQLSFGYVQSHLWRNFGILLAFGVFFFIVLLTFTEFNAGVSAQSSVLLFKAGSKTDVVEEAKAAVGGDEEKADAGKNSGAADTEEKAAKEEAAKAMEKTQPKSTNVFSWQHINYTVPVSGDTKTRQLLDNVSGYVAPGELTALMGESGAGKTTLLNVLAERTSSGVITGDRFINGHDLPSDFQAQTGYCMQADIHMPKTTVLEALEFSARTRQPSDVSVAEKDAYAKQCLTMCGLQAYGDAIVGSLGVEHRKRLTIGVELAAKVKLLLFLDEPTSGLDSISAWNIMVFLRSLADAGQAILCTIHQPSAELFQMFDRLLLLRKGGQTVYFGDIGHHSEILLSYFERAGATACKPDENPAEYILTAIGAGATATADRDFHDIWTNSKEYHQVQDEVEKIHAEGRSRPPIESTLKSDFAASWPVQVRLLTVRNFVSYWRDPDYLMGKLMLNITGGLFIGFTFWKSKDTMQGTQNFLFSIFMALIMSAPLSGQLHVPLINTRDIYETREKNSKMFHFSALLLSQLIPEFFWNIIGSSLFFFCWYWTVGYDTSRAGYTYLMYGVLFPLFYTSIAQAVAALAETAEIAGIIFSTVFSFILTFNGVVQPFKQLNWWKWMYRTSPYTYLVEGLLGNGIGRKNINCAELEFAVLKPPSGQSCEMFLGNFITTAGGYLKDPSAMGSCQYCSSRTTDAFLARTFNIFYDHRWRNVGLFCAYIAFNVFLLFAINYLYRVRKWRK